MWQPPTFPLKAEILQLRLRYTTMCQRYTRANICDLDSTFKNGPIDRSFTLLYFTSWNANWFILFSMNLCLALLLALLFPHAYPCLSRAALKGVQEFTSYGVAVGFIFVFLTETYNHAITLKNHKMYVFYCRKTLMSPFLWLSLWFLWALEGKWGIEVW